VDECKPLAEGHAHVERYYPTYGRVHGRGFHSFTLELNLSNSRTHS
jgi:hypothetical protein